MGLGVQAPGLLARLRTHRLPLCANTALAQAFAAWRSQCGFEPSGGGGRWSQSPPQWEGRTWLLPFPFPALGLLLRRGRAWAGPPRGGLDLRLCPGFVATPRAPPALQGDCGYSSASGAWAARPRAGHAPLPASVSLSVPAFPRWAHCPPDSAGREHRAPEGKLLSVCLASLESSSQTVPGAPRGWSVISTGQMRPPRP